MKNSQKISGQPGISYIIEPAVAMSGCYPNSRRIKAKEGTIVSVEKAPLSGYVVIAEFEE